MKFQGTAILGLIASGLLLGQAVADEPVRWQAAISLTDGSRLVGEPVAAGLSIQSAGVGTLSVPWPRIRNLAVESGTKSVDLILANRDKMHGTFAESSLALKTLFGTRNIPVALIRQAQFRPAGARDVTWEVLPIAPHDFDTRPNAPAKIDDGAVTLDGWQVRSQRTFARPITFECNATLKEIPANDATLTLRFVPSDEPRDIVPTRAVLVTIGQRRDGRQFVTVSRNDAPPVVLYEELGKLNVGEPYAIRVRWDDDRIEVSLNDSTFVTRAVTAWYERFHLDLAGGQFGEQWQVTDCVVRTP